MNVMLFGATGMVGHGVLRECLLDPEVTRVLSVARSSTGQRQEKLGELLHRDFTDFSPLRRGAARTLLDKADINALAAGR